MKTIKETGSRTEIRSTYSTRKTDAEAEEPIGIQLSENVKEKKNRYIGFELRLGIGDKAVHVYDGSLTPCIITGINNISLKDGYTESGEFGVNYKIMFLHNGMDSTAFGSMLLTTEEAIDHFMIFASINKDNVREMIKEHKEN